MVAATSAFVTGGSGFIGGRLVRRLVEEGWRVRALTRSSRSSSVVESLGAEAVAGDLEDPDAMSEGAAGCSVTFHLAAHLGQWGSREDFERGNVTGTRHALEASERAGVGRFVHCSTEAVLLGGEPLVGVDESAPRRPDSRSLYAATKARAEEEVLRGGRKIATVVVRPRLVWGAGDTTLLPEILEAVRKGRFKWIGGGRHRTSTTHVDNVVEGLLLAAERGEPGQVYFVTDGEPVVFRDFVSTLIASGGEEPPTGSLPAPVALATAATSELAWRTLPLRGEPPLTRLAYWLSAQECTIDITKARRDLGYEPVTSREDGLEEMRADA